MSKDFILVDCGSIVGSLCNSFNNKFYLRKLVIMNMQNEPNEYCIVLDAFCCWFLTCLTKSLAAGSETFKVCGF